MIEPELLRRIKHLEALIEKLEVKVNALEAQYSQQVSNITSLTNVVNGITRTP